MTQEGSILRKGLSLILLAAVSLLLSPVLVCARSFYVDFKQGNDLNSGMSAAKPWKRCPGDESYRGSGSLRPGDIIHFKRGVAYQGMITTVSPSVRYTVTDWGKGDATIDGSGLDACFVVGHSGISIDGGAGKNLILTGKTLRHAAIWNWAPHGLTGSAFLNLKIAEVGGPSSDEGIGIKIGGNSAVYSAYTISHNIISDCYSAGIKISGSGTHDVDIHHNILQGNGTLPGERCQVNLSSNDGQGVQKVRFHDNTVARGGSNANGINCNNANNDIYRNTISGNSGHGISLTMNYNTNYSGITRVFANTISGNTGGYGIIVGDSDGQRNVLLYNNILTDNGWYDLNFSGAASHNRVYNNTILHSKPGHGIRVQKDCENNSFKNNVIVTKGGYAIHDSTGSMEEDFNTSYRESGGPVMVWKDRIYRSISEYRDESSQGARSSWENPLLVDASMRLSGNSPCRGTGNNLFSIFAADRDGAVRPKNGGWDRGAYQSGH